MAVYSYQCSNCGRIFDTYKSMDRMDEPQLCECGEIAQRVFTGAPNIGVPKAFQAELKYTGKRP